MLVVASGSVGREERGWGGCYVGMEVWGIHGVEGDLRAAMDVGKLVEDGGWIMFGGTHGGRMFVGKVRRHENMKLEVQWDKESGDEALVVRW